MVISTCCHTVNLLVQKYYPEALGAGPRAVPHAGPLQGYQAALPEARTVFIGPGISKKDEAEELPRRGGLRAHL